MAYDKSTLLKTNRLERIKYIPDNLKILVIDERTSKPGDDYHYLVSASDLFDTLDEYSKNIVTGRNFTNEFLLMGA